jgi:hypothetical protein
MTTRRDEENSAMQKHTTELALVPMSPPDRPARFASWPDDVKERCKALWSSIGNRDAGRTAWLYAAEVAAELGEGVAVPAASTIRAWARQESWAAWADRDLAASHGKTLKELRAGWLAALVLAQSTLIDAMCGRLDDLPYGGAGRLKSAEVTLKTIAQSGLLAIAPEPETERTDWDSLTMEEKEAVMRDRLQARKRERAGG